MLAPGRMKIIGWPLVAFLGIDQSLNATGICRLAPNGSVQAMATVNPEGRLDAQRLVFIKRAVASFAADVKFAALEGYSYDSVGRVFELGEIGGVIKTLLVELNIGFVVVPPVQLKKFATGTTFASKEAMVEAAKGAKATVGDDNQADAFFLARIARAYDTTFDDLRRCEHEVIHALRNPTSKKAARRVRRLVKAAI